MPRPQDIIGRHAQPRALTARAVGFAGGREGTATDTTGQALYAGAWRYDETATYGEGGRLTYNGAGHYDAGNQYYTP